MNVASKLSLFLAEFRRRKVGRVAVVYVLVGLGAIEAVDIIGSRLLFPAWAIQFFIVLVLIGFPIALVLAWALEVTPRGIKKTPDLTADQLAPHAPAQWKASTWVLTGVALVAVGAVVFLVFSRGGEASGVTGRGHRVAVLPLENLTGDPSLDGLGLTASDWITEGLVRTELFQVVPFNEVLASSDALLAAGSPSSALSLTWPEETGASVALLGSFSTLGDSVQFRLRLVDQQGTVLRTVDPVNGVAGNPSAALGGLQTRTMATVARVLMPGHELSWSATGREPPHPDAHEAYLEAMRKVGSGSWEASNREALEHLNRALEIDPDFLNPLLMTPPVLWNLDRYAEADSVCQILEGRADEFVREQRLHWQLECSDDRISELNAAKEIARFVSGMEQRVGMHAIWANRPGEALEACSRYDPHLSRMAWRWSPLGICLTALHMLGDYEGQLTFIQEWESRRPADRRGHQTDALIALGRHEEAETVIEERLSELEFDESPFGILNRAALEYDAHGQPKRAQEYWDQYLQWHMAQVPEDLETPFNRRREAETRLFLGRDEEALVLLAALAEDNPGNIADRGRLGVVQAKLGDRTEAERTSEILVSMDQPFRGGQNTAWMAYIAAYLGDLDGAVRLLGEAIDGGWAVGLEPHRSPYLKPLREYEPFEQLTTPKG
jgi:tetratricopeptide (TPR) repeat protein/TolB-like protein